MMIAQQKFDRPAAIVAGARTPFTKIGDALRDVHLCELAARCMQHALYRANWKFDQLDEVILATAAPGIEAGNAARTAAVWAGISHDVAAVTVQRADASGMEAVARACAQITSGSAKAVLAAGAESMSNMPMLLPQQSIEPMSRLAGGRLWQRAKAAARLRPRHFNPVPALKLASTDPVTQMNRYQLAQKTAHEMGVTRQQQDEFALRSHHRARSAADAGRFDGEVHEFYSSEGIGPVAVDAAPQSELNIDELSHLAPVADRRDGTVTRGNCSPDADGAVAMLVLDKELADAHSLPVLGYVRGYVCLGVDPVRAGLAPAIAAAKLLSNAGIAASDVGLFEFNETSAAEVLSCAKALGSSNLLGEYMQQEQTVADIDMDKLNANGGAIALGNPTGAGAARLVWTLLMQMHQHEAEFAIAASRAGSGQAAAMLLQRS